MASTPRANNALRDWAPAFAGEEASHIFG